MGVELRLPTKLGSAGFSGLSAVVGALDDPLSLVLGQSAQERDKATANRCGQVKVGFVQHLDQSPALVDALNQMDAIHHRAGHSIPFSYDHHVTGAELVDRLFELRTVCDVLSGHLLAKNFRAA